MADLFETGETILTDGYKRKKNTNTFNAAVAGIYTPFLFWDKYIILVFVFDFFIDLNINLQNKFSLQEKTCHLIWIAKARV